MQGYLSKEDINTFYRQGYVVKKNCIPSAEVKVLDSIIDDVLVHSVKDIKSEGHSIDAANDQTTHINGARVVFRQGDNRDIKVVRINGVSGFSPILLQTLRSDKLCHTFLELLKCKEIEHIINQMHPKLPSDGVVYHKHKDVQFRRDFDPNWSDVLDNGSGSYAICILAVDSMSRENGGLYIDPSTFDPKSPLPARNTVDDELVWVTAEPGDLLFMHPHLDHGSKPNTSISSRKTLLSGFCALNANTKTYPGTDVNDIISVDADGTSILTRPAEWKDCVVQSQMTTFH